MAGSCLVGMTPLATAATPTPTSTHVCDAPAEGFASCLAMAVTDARGKIARFAGPTAAGFTPTDVQTAYNLSGLQSGGRTVAIVDAFGYPSLESDLATYRANYGLPACTTGNGCLQILDQRGGHSLPPYDSGWALEQSLDVDAVSATCPDCKIVMVQADSNSWENLGTAVNLAASLPGVVAISNSYAGGDGTEMSYYNHPGIAITAATGDWGWQGGAYPAIDSHVVAVSGTSVTRDGSARGYSETTWSDTGSGCSNYVPKPKWQNKSRIDTHCSKRAMGDVSAASDPNLGGLNIVFNGGWAQVGGTSEATPIIAAVYALSGKTKGYPAKKLYKKKKAKKGLYDITTGSNGSCGVPICGARKGWDGVTGMGTPKGIKAF
jgi:subtilase family serine protease